MAQVIPFPGTVPRVAPQPTRRPAKARPAAARGKVVKIRHAMTMPKANRPEDSEAIAFARIADGFANQAYELAQTAPNSEDHRNALAMAAIADKLPRNNLRIFTTPEDVVQGLWKAKRRVDIANAEAALADLHRCDAIDDNDDDARTHWTAKLDEAEARLWLEYERLLRIPATSVTQHNQFKRGKWDRGVGVVDWMRKYKPELAAIMDDELARLEAEKAARGTKRKGAACSAGEDDPAGVSIH
jgi:hypothetical protein